MNIATTTEALSSNDGAAMRGATTATDTAPRADDAVTWVITHQIRLDRRDDFESWVDGIGRELAEFPGHRGTTVLRPTGDADDEYVLVVRFDSDEDLRHWETSPTRTGWLADLQPMLADDSTYRTETGLETWFQLPAHRTVLPPPKWKMAMLVLLAIYPLLLIVIPLMGRLFADVPLLGIPITLDIEFFVRTLVTTGILVTLMTWAAMPLLTWVFRRWLYPRR